MTTENGKIQHLTILSTILSSEFFFLPPLGVVITFYEDIGIGDEEIIGSSLSHRSEKKNQPISICCVPQRLKTTFWRWPRHQSIVINNSDKYLGWAMTIVTNDYRKERQSTYHCQSCESNILRQRRQHYFGKIVRSNTSPKNKNESSIATSTKSRD